MLARHEMVSVIALGGGRCTFLAALLENDVLGHVLAAYQRGRLDKRKPHSKKDPNDVDIGLIHRTLLVKRFL